ncbi:zinc finger protein-like 1 homolog [Impatiens glandulifera]|uniref:zinc finger protein-like 1 homolog n=1 Tax=Impatiens glandulifera TaxID=253017 RepID=UPI001FB0CB7F|nr:zinc finger protein-like 1 homolog [Impatiens glandulifera]
MVVCKCRKATKLYCFVHKVPVCGECICFAEHQICVARTYSEWVIDGEYDWPPKCCLCLSSLEEGANPQTTRLGCLHVMHTNCLASHIKSFPEHTAPAGYGCPTCNTSIWPPKMIKDSGSRLHSKLKEAIMQTGLEKNLFGNHPVSLVGTTESSHTAPPAFASDPLVNLSTTDGNNSSIANGSNVKASVSDIVEVDGSTMKSPLTSPQSDFMKSSSPSTQAGATTRKGAFQVERQNSEFSYYADDEDANQKKYSRRGSLQLKFLRALIPFWSSSLPTLPVTAPPRKDAADAPQEGSGGRSRHHRPSRMDPRKILLFIAIMACMATMGILYYRISEGGLGDEPFDDDQLQQLQQLQQQ